MTRDSKSKSHFCNRNRLKNVLLRSLLPITCGPSIPNCAIVPSRVLNSLILNRKVSDLWRSFHLKNDPFCSLCWNPNSRKMLEIFLASTSSFKLISPQLQATFFTIKISTDKLLSVEELYILKVTDFSPFFGILLVEKC